MQVADPAQRAVSCLALLPLPRAIKNFFILASFPGAQTQRKPNSLIKAGSPWDCQFPCTSCVKPHRAWLQQQRPALHQRLPRVSCPHTVPWASCSSKQRLPVQHKGGGCLPGFFSVFLERLSVAALVGMGYLALVKYLPQRIEATAGLFYVTTLAAPAQCLTLLPSPLQVFLLRTFWQPLLCIVESYSALLH